MGVGSGGWSREGGVGSEGAVVGGLGRMSHLLCGESSGNLY